MKSIVKTAKTVDDAIKLSLEELSVDMDDVSIEILEEPNKGFLGIIGAKDAKVKVTIDKDPEVIARDFLAKLLDKLNVQGEIVINKKNSNLYIRVDGEKKEDMGVIIGKRGKTLDSIQYLLSLVVNKNRDKYIRILLDTENYRKKREDTLIRLAKKMSFRVKETGKRIRLEPMNPYERRVIHSALQGDSYVYTHSEGEEPYRRVVIDKKR
ncbi:RNA-binding cell elongation regulator Jag/EloR [Clostridiisalibacter paucivorans]|uniref:RNA-binding cell elongation regulator Jag/EloR n=1 Tax=Clostridiisalibacter paucivorans TaxID=408753 RepID=UPI00047AB7B0|nr:RNA-binding cell elongation regulator Jag/EloR [Clostridiisalibacter paucivorans]